MRKYFLTAQDKLLELERPEPGCWIMVEKPDGDDKNFLIDEIGVESSYLAYALDLDEQARVEFDDEQTYIVIDQPIYSDDGSGFYETTPLSIFIMDKYIITISLHENNRILQDFTKAKVKEFYTQYRARFILQIMLKTSSAYLACLKELDRISSSNEQRLYRSMRNNELMDLLRVDKSLVYISTALRSNNVLLGKISRSPGFKHYPEDEDLIDDVKIENNQAIEMANIYINIIGSTMDAYGAVVANNQNSAMKILTGVTIILGMPSIISGLWGMNVAVPWQDVDSIWPFIIIVLFIILLCYISYKVMKYFDLL